MLSSTLHTSETGFRGEGHPLRRTSAYLEPNHLWRGFLSSVRRPSFKLQNQSDERMSVSMGEAALAGSWASVRKYGAIGSTFQGKDALRNYGRNYAGHNAGGRSPAR